MKFPTISFEDLREKKIILRAVTKSFVFMKIRMVGQKYKNSLLPVRVLQAISKMIRVIETRTQTHSTAEISKKKNIQRDVYV